MSSLVSPLAMAVDYFVPDAEANASSPAIAAYLRAYTAVGSLVVDPFCQSPDIVREALASQRRVIAISFSPLNALRTRLALSALSAHELEEAVTRLADSPKADVPLREHLQRLYRTACRQCKKTVIADYFVWERGHELPSQVHYHCVACSDAGRRDCDENDARILQEVQPRGLHYWHILERVVGRKSRVTKFVASLLELYTPRNLYVLSNVLLKIESLFSGSSMRDYLRLGLLHALEQGSKLHVVPGEPAPPHALGLHPPPRFVEWNAWQLFEEATRGLAQHQPTAPVMLVASIQELLARAPSAPTEVGLSTHATAEPARPAAAFVGHLTVRELAPALPPESVSLIWAQPPSLGRTQWALPYLWTGWLYGYEEAASLWPLVKRHSSDWAWFLQAMRGTLLALQKTLPADGHMVLVGQSKGLAFSETLALAAAGASLRLESALYHSREPEAPTKPFGGLRGDYRSVWVPGPSAPAWPMAMTDLTAKLRDIAVSAAEETLQARGEPAPFARLHCHIWEALARRGILQRIMASKELSAPLEWVREQIQGALQDEVQHTFVQLWEDGPAPSERDGVPEGECLWWLVHAPSVPPLAERVERAVYETLTTADAVGIGEFLMAVYGRFPGMLTPDAEWVMACLRSYGRPVEPAHWTVREEERPSARTRARETVLYTLQDLGQRCGYEAKLAQGLAMRWVQTGTPPLGLRPPGRTASRFDGSGKELLVWAILDTAGLSPLLDAASGELSAGARQIAIITDARLDLIRLRWGRATLLRQEFVARGWQFIHEHDLHQWAGRHDITLMDLDTLVGPDPLALPSRTQLSLI